MKEKDALIAGVKSSIPIIMGYLPIGMAYGLLAVKSGLNYIEAVSMSIFVFAGSSQLISVNMFAVGAGVFPILMMTFLVNLRHILMSAFLSLQFKETPGKLLPVLGFFITDESFAVASAGFEQEEDKGLFFLGLGLSAYIGWVLSSLIGSVLGTFLPIAELPGLDFVLPAMFIILLIIQLREKREVLIALISAVFSIIFLYLLPDNWNIITATILAATIGVALEGNRE